MTETHEQRVERLARAIWEHELKRLDSFLGLIQWDDADEEFREKTREDIRAIIASDREAGLVTVPREEWMHAVAHLVGAASAYRKYASRHRSQGRALPDPMFSTRAADFEKAAKRAQDAAIAAHEQEER